MIVLLLYTLLRVFICSEESVLRDLKALLMEAKQKVPPFLLELDSLSSDLLELGGRLHQWRVQWGALGA